MKTQTDNNYGNLESCRAEHRFYVFMWGTRYRDCGCWRAANEPKQYKIYCPKSEGLQSFFKPITNPRAQPLDPSDYSSNKGLLE